ncbi:deoxyribose-phosphate aldolase [Bacillus solitudinis]|uniref:deoxyribose-phosphate aldolase n=1 Tax=Bacillus solitudinis TaxID=2014074 RepID=UPI000C24B646|nr:deoxyribose-phosphate aldolase [Bacillus solitudinis]
MLTLNQAIASYIDHTALKADTTKEQIVKLCEEAINHQFASVCVNPTWVKLAATLLSNDSVKVCTVVGFPLGTSTSEVKAFEATNAIGNGATEIDMVLNIGALKDRNFEVVEKDIRAVVEAAGDRALTKVIIETSLLTEEEKIHACELVVKAGAAFVKTSTGFSTGGATIEDIKLMRKVVGPELGVKASGGIRNAADTLAMIKAGATRIGASAGVSIIKGEQVRTDY